MKKGFYLFFKIFLCLFSYYIHSSIYGNFLYSKKIPLYQIKTLEKDLSAFEKFNIYHFGREEDDELLKIFNLTDLNSYNLKKWLHKRVSIILDSDPSYRFYYPFVVESLNQRYPKTPFPAKKFTKQRGDHSQHSMSTDKLKIMNNVGAKLYFYGKKNHSLISINPKLVSIANNGRRDRVFSKTFFITSPRNGLIQLEKDFFTYSYNIFKNEGPGAQIFRLSVLFHEARHSDGNGKHLAFFHYYCPKDHLYAGQGACDNNTNGPYSVGAHVIRKLTERCSSCTSREREILKMKYLDNLSRIIVDDNGEETFWDEESEHIEI